MRIHERLRRLEREIPTRHSPVYAIISEIGGGVHYRAEYSDGMNVERLCASIAAAVEELHGRGFATVLALPASGGVWIYEKED